MRLLVQVGTACVAVCFGCGSSFFFGLYGRVFDFGWMHLRCYELRYGWIVAANVVVTLFTP